MENRSITQRLNFLWQGLDPTLGVILLFLVVIGNITFMSASSGTVVSWVEQARNILSAAIIMWITSRIPIKWLEKISLWVYLFGVALLIGVAVFGLVKKGARRWLNIGVVIQPSEIMKIAMPMMLAWYFQKKDGLIQLRDFFIAF